MRILPEEPARRFERPVAGFVAQFASDLAEIAAGLLSGIAAFTQEKTMMRRESARFS
jgi:hypothetical protein